MFTEDMMNIHSAHAHSGIVSMMEALAATSIYAIVLKVVNGLVVKVG